SRRIGPKDIQEDRDERSAPYDRQQGNGPIGRHHKQPERKVRTGDEHEDPGSIEVRKARTRRRSPTRTVIKRTGTETSRNASGERRCGCTSAGIVRRQDEYRCDCKREVEAELVEHPSELWLDTLWPRDHRHILGP